MAQACNPSTLGGQGRWIRRSRDRDHPGQHGETLSLGKIQKVSWAWWRVPVIPATREAEAGELPDHRRRRLRWAEIMILHSSLGNKSETPSQKKKKIICLCHHAFMFYMMYIAWNYLLLSLWPTSALFLKTWHYECLLLDLAREHKSIHSLVPLLSLPKAVALMAWMNSWVLATWHVFQPPTLTISPKETWLQNLYVKIN